MSDLVLGSDGDLLIEDTNLLLNSGVEAIRQHLSIRLKTFLGEWFLNRSVGVAYFQRIFIKNPSLAILNNEFTSIILNTPGVVSLNTLEFELESNRALSVTFTATTTEGVLNFTEIIEV